MQAVVTATSAANQISENAYILRAKKANGHKIFMPNCTNQSVAAVRRLCASCSVTAGLRKIKNNDIPIMTYKILQTTGKTTSGGVAGGNTNKL